jgi:hypothetical protein
MMTYLFDSWVEQCIGKSCHYLVSSIFLESVNIEKFIHNTKSDTDKRKEKNQLNPEKL